jgi:hypothetical protein
MEVFVLFISGEPIDNEYGRAVAIEEWRSQLALTDAIEADDPQFMFEISAWPVGLTRFPGTLLTGKVIRP